jgi:hypothetical protein
VVVGLIATNEQGLPMCKNWQGAVQLKNNGCRDIRQPHL